MDPLERRVARHLDELASGHHTTDPGVHTIMSEGDRRRHRRTTITGAAAVVAAIGMVAATVLIVRGDGGSAPADEPGPTTLLPPEQQLPAAVRGDVPIEWQVVDAATTGQPTDVFGTWNRTTSIYSLGTAAGPNGVIDQQLFTSADGITFTPAGPALPDGMYVGRLDGSDASSVYALGTAGRNGAAPVFSTWASDDGGSSWVEVPLPIDVGAIHEAIGNVQVVAFPAADVASGSGNVVATASPVVWKGSAITGVDAPFGSELTDTGVAVFGAPTDLDAIERRECPAGWDLVDGATGLPLPARDTATATTLAPGGPSRAPSAGGEAAPPGTGATVASTIVIPAGPVGTVPAGQPVCQDPKNLGEWLWIDPARVRGEVTHEIPYEQLGLAPDVVKALRREVRVFRLVDSRWVEVALPRMVRLADSPSAQLLWTGSKFVLSVATTTGAAVFLSPDGASWSEASLPPGVSSGGLAALPEGRLLVVGTRGGDLVAYTSDDGTQWAGVSLDSVLALPAGWRIDAVRMASGPVGTGLVVAARRDEVSSSGGLPIRHDDFTLVVTDENQSLRLLDRSGTTLDELVVSSNGIDLGRGMIRRLDNGAVTVLDARGVQVDSFAQSELELAVTGFFREMEEGRGSRGTPPAFWVLATLDGVTWDPTGLDGLGLTGSLAYLRAPFATPTALSFGFGLNNVGPQQGRMAVLVGTRTG